MQTDPVRPLSLAQTKRPARQLILNVINIAALLLRPTATFCSFQSLFDTLETRKMKEEGTGTTQLFL